jgi:hypothetical protein
MAGSLGFEPPRHTGGQAVVDRLRVESAREEVEEAAVCGMVEGSHRLPLVGARIIQRALALAHVLDVGDLRYCHEADRG